jgi:hypothetical protein
VPKEVGEARLKEGTKGDAVGYRSLDGYVFDSNFAVQQIRLTCLGVREASRNQVVEELEQIVKR